MYAYSHPDDPAHGTGTLAERDLPDHRRTSRCERRSGQPDRRQRQQREPGATRDTAPETATAAAGGLRRRSYVDFATAATNFRVERRPQGRRLRGQSSPCKRCDVYGVDSAAADADRRPVLTSKSADSSDANGTVGDKRSFQMAISATGQFAALTSDATNFVPSAVTRTTPPDVFVKEWMPPLIRHVRPRSHFTDTPVGATSGPFTAPSTRIEFGPWSAAQVSRPAQTRMTSSSVRRAATHQVFHIGQPCAVAVIFHPTGIGLRNATAADHARRDTS